MVSFGVSSVSASEEDAKLIKEIQRNAALRDPRMAAAHLTGAQAEAMQTAAANEGGMGAIGAFMGMGMAQNATGNTAANLFGMAQQQQPAQAQAAGWTCPSCGQAGNTGKFCTNCGQPNPVHAAAAAVLWTCPACGTQNSGKFCSECGAPRPQPARYACNKCGWVPEDPTHPPKFCPECGDPFNDDDIQRS